MLINSIDQIRKLSNLEMQKLANKYGINTEFNRRNTIFELSRILVHQMPLHASGILDVSGEGFGFLRTADNSYLPSRNDIYVSPHFIKEYLLKTGDRIEGIVTKNVSFHEYAYYAGIEEIISINYDENLKGRNSIVRFNDLIPEFPTRAIRLDVTGNDQNSLIGRVISLIAPIGFGQRALIVAPPRAGKTFIIKSIAKHIEEQHPEAILMVFLVDERPEEVTEMKKIIKSEVISSTFDEHASRHIRIAEMVINRAKRLVEHGHDVIILLDSITRLSRAYNSVAPSSGRALSGGIESNALQMPKKFLGAARNIRDGGSLTIIGSALVETGSKMDEVIFEEFKGTGNCEISLDRKLANRNIFPAIDVHKSGTRMDHLLYNTYGEKRASEILMLKTVLGTMSPTEASEFLIHNVMRTKNNEEFFATMNKV